MPTLKSEKAAVALAWQRAYAGQQDNSRTGPAELQGRSDRAASDAVAAWVKWQVAPQSICFTPTEAIWYGLLERARVETLASRELPGIAYNLSDVTALLPAGELPARLFEVARAIFSGADKFVPILPVKPVVQGESGQGKTSLLVRLRKRLRPTAKGSQPERDTGSFSSLSDDEVRSLIQQAAPLVQQPEAFALTLQPLIHWLAINIPAELPLELPGMPMAKPSESEEGGDLLVDDEAIHELEGGGREAEQATQQWPGYRIYTTSRDELRTAASFYHPGEHPAVEKLIGPRREQVLHLARRLQRRLMVARQRTWSYDLEEGQLDRRRLARLLVPGNGRAVFRQESETQVPEACVTLLVDQSGSMNAKRRQMVAMAIDLTVQTLENCRIACEVLGFTTRYGKSNPLVTAWRASGSPVEPGRLNALRHIMYKQATQPWRSCRPYLELLLRDGFGKENIDGEALDWAARRLAARPETLKVLMVLCDGVPFDSATGQAHDRSFLETHLRQVITAIEASPIHLAAIGAGQDVGRFYRHALTLRHQDDIAQVLFEQLGDLLTRPRNADHKSLRKV